MSYRDDELNIEQSFDNVRKLLIFFLYETFRKLKASLPPPRTPSLAPFQLFTSLLDSTRAPTVRVKVEATVSFRNGFCYL